MAALLLRVLIPGLLLPVPLLAAGQQPPAPKKVLTPDQATYQAASAKWLAEYNGLRAKLQAAYAAEMARDMAGDCPSADTTLAENDCLSHEITVTRANYATVVGALRQALGLAHPRMPGETPSPGPTGASLIEAERVAEFDRLDAASATYRKLAVEAAYNTYKGGTLAPVAAAEAEQKLARMHLEELAFVYDAEFSMR